jgi:hypothetical protein
VSTLDILNAPHSRRSAIKRLAALGLVAIGSTHTIAGARAAERTTLWAWLYDPVRLPAEGQYEVTIDYEVQFSAAHLADLDDGSVFYLECRFWDYDGTSSDDIIYAWHYTNRDLPSSGSRRAPAQRITASTPDGGGRVAGYFRKRMVWSWLDQDPDYLTESFYAGLHLIDAQTYDDVLGVDPWHSNHVDRSVPL